MQIKVVVSGAAGRMGQEVCRAVIGDPALELAAAIDKDPRSHGKPVCADVDMTTRCAEISGDLKAALAGSPDVMIDFTHPSAVMGNIDAAVAAGVHCVVGTTGISMDDINDLDLRIAGTGVNILIAPNFAIGAVLMIKMSEVAAGYMEACEIIELHHDKKADAPSGTAIKTAEAIGRAETARLKPGEKETIDGARGAATRGVHIHSVRLPGLVAHQEVIFGGVGQTLTIRHDTIDRTSFMPGVLLAAKEVGNRPGLTYGLEGYLDLG
jgi:4-hydroxy-tetrahydrodipicolinate reductase